MTLQTAPDGVDVVAPAGGLPAAAPAVLTAEALAFVAGLQREFRGRRAQVLSDREERQAHLSAGGTLELLPGTASVRDGDWRVAPAPADLADRRVEITGPTEAKMLINALNSGANVHMTDFEDANAPTFDNMVQGQANIVEAIERRLTFESPDGREYSLVEDPAVLMVRPRGWHLPEKHVVVDGEAMSGSLFDFGLCLFHCARRLQERGSGPYFYLPKLESHTEARLWNDVFCAGQDALGIPRGSIRATVLVETISAAFEMEEILYELRDHSAGLNAGRWDYMFSLIKKFRARGAEYLLPDRNAVTMTAPFMRAYTELLVRTCHRRGAHAIGGMAAFIPSRRDPRVNEAALGKVADDKRREAGDGFDGSWVAHPDLVEVCRRELDLVLGGRPNQLGRLREDVSVTPAQLLAVAETPGETTLAGLRNDVSVGLQYLESWLRGQGAVGIFNLMEDAATAEIARSQVWQWVHNDVVLAGGEAVTPELVRRVATEELEKVRDSVGAEAFAAGRYTLARELFERVALDDDFAEFLTLPAYDHLD
ncbi:MAG: malate synthase A [Acidimicrobiales bacterium]